MGKGEILEDSVMQYSYKKWEPTIIHIMDPFILFIIYKFKISC